MNIDNINEKGLYNPCQIPEKKPASEEYSCSYGLGQGRQPDSNSMAKTKTHILKEDFLIFIN